MTKATTINLPERFDFSSHKSFNESADAALKATDSNSINLDFSNVSYLDSAALGMMVYLHKKASSANKKLHISNAHGVAAEILQVANIDKIISII